MPTLSCNWAIGLSVVFLLFLFRAYTVDTHRETLQARDLVQCSTCSAIGNHPLDTPAGVHAAVVETMRNEQAHGVFSESKVKKMLNNSRDMMVRGAIMGALTGNPVEIVSNAITWCLVSGVVSGISDIMPK